MRARGVAPDGVRVTSMLRDGAVGYVEDRLRKRKLQHHLACIIGDLDDRIQQRAVGAFGFQQFPDHGARHFPGAVGIPEHFALGIGDQLIGDTGVEEISWHRRQPAPVVASQTESRLNLTSSLSGTVNAPSNQKSVRVAMQTTAKGLIPRCFDRDRLHNSVNYLAMQHRPAGVFGKRFHWRTSRSAVPYPGGRSSSGIKRSAKWPGKHQRSSKCRSAWKST